MRRSIYIIIGLAALFACKREDPLAPFRDESKFVIPQTGSNITVMTYNIFGASGNTNLDSVATVINAAKPDFVMIQEVDSCTPRSGRNIHQAKVLAEKTGMKYCYQVAWDRGNVDVLNSYFGYTIHTNRGKPTNSEFIAMISDKLRLRLRFAS